MSIYKDEERDQIYLNVVRKSEKERERVPYLLESFLVLKIEGDVK